MKHPLLQEAMLEQSLGQVPLPSVLSAWLELTEFKGQAYQGTWFLINVY